MSERSGVVVVERDSGPSGERGAVFVLASISLVALLAFASLAVDLGYQRVVRRDAQATADVIALDLARRIDGRTADELLADPAFVTAIDDSRERNDFAAGEGRALVVELGLLDPATHELSVVMRTWARSGGSTPVTGGTLGGEVPDAVRVRASDTAGYFFRPGSGTVERSAVASIDEGGLASFSVGSFLAGVDPMSSSVIGQVLNDVIPGASVLSYQGLAGAQVALGDLMVPLGVGSVEEVLSTQISFRDLILASIAALDQQPGRTAAVAVLNGLVNAAPTVDQIRIGDLLDADLTGGSPAGTATIDVLSLLTSSVFLADGDHLITLPGTQLGIPGIAQVTAELNVIEPPRFGGFREGATASTGQFSLRVTPTVNLSTTAVTVDLCDLPSSERGLIGSLVGGVVDLLTCILGGVLDQVVSVDITGSVPLRLDVAGAVATLTDIDCANEAITVAPEPVPLRVGVDSNLRVEARVLGRPLPALLTARLLADASAVGSAPPQTFLHPSQFGQPRRFGASPIGLSGLLDFTATDVTVAGANLTALSNLLIAPTFGLVNGLLGSVDSLVLGRLTRALGLPLAGADLTALSLDCDRGGTRLVG